MVPHRALVAGLLGLLLLMAGLSLCKWSSSSSPFPRRLGPWLRALRDGGAEAALGRARGLQRLAHGTEAPSGGPARALAAPPQVPAAPPQIVYVRIPKTASTSMEAMLYKSKSIAAKRIDSNEYCLPFKVWEAQQHNRTPFMLISVREPRSHVYSQFLECRYDLWGRAVTNHTGFPRGGTDIDDFRKWLRYFWDHGGAWSHGPLRGVMKGVGDLVRRYPKGGEMKQVDFDCYNPFNLQARAFTCGMGGKLASHHVFETGTLPDLHTALDNLKAASWVGVAELFHESYCVAHFHILGQLDSTCDCGGARPIDVHIDHNVPKHRVSDLPADAIAMIDAMTTVDRQVYVAAVRRLLGEIRDVESKTGVKILCPASLDALKAQTSYIADIWFQIADIWFQMDDP